MPLFIIPCYGPVWVVAAILLRVLTCGLLIILLPTILIPPCTCIYPLLAVILLLRNGEIPEDMSDESDIVSFLFDTIGQLTNSTTDLSVYFPENNWARAQQKDNIIILKTRTNERRRKQRNENLSRAFILWSFFWKKKRIVLVPNVKKKGMFYLERNDLIVLSTSKRTTQIYYFSFYVIFISYKFLKKKG